MKRNVHYLSYLLLFLIAFFLHLRLIIFRPPATDEIWALLLSQASFKDIWLGTLSEFHGPLYFMILRFISLISKASLQLITVRLISLVFSYLSLLFLFRLYNQVAKAKLDKKGFLVLFLPSFVWISIFGRYYSLLFLLTTLVLLSFVNYLKKKSAINLAFLVVIMTMGIYIHYYFLLLICALTTYLFCFEKKTLRRNWLLALMISALLSLPNFYFFFSLAKPQAIGLTNYWLKIPSLISSYLISFESILFLYYQANLINILLLILETSCLLLLLTITFNNWVGKFKYLFLTTLLLPPLISLLISYWLRPAFAVNSFLIFLPAFLIVFAQGFNFINKKKLYLLIFLLFLCFNLIIFGQTSARLRSANRAYRYLKNEVQKGDLILHAHAYTFVEGQYYLNKYDNLAIIPSTQTKETEKAIGYQVIPLEKILSHKGRIFYIEPVFYNQDQAKQLKKVFDDRLELISQAWFQENIVNIYLYQNKRLDEKNI